MCIEVAFSNFIDERNNDLYSFVSKYFDITLFKCVPPPDLSDFTWHLQIDRQQSRNASISYYKDSTSSSSFTHELLHLKLVALGFVDTNILFLDYLQSKGGGIQVIPVPFVDINNAFAHQKFFSEFVEMGYAASEFTSDFFSYPDVDLRYFQIENEFHSGSFPNVSLRTFITSFFSARDNRNQEYKERWESLLKKLKYLNPALYAILENAWEQWVFENELNVNARIIIDLANRVEHLFNSVA